VASTNTSESIMKKKEKLKKKIEKFNSDSLKRKQKIKVADGQGGMDAIVPFCEYNVYKTGGGGTKFMHSLERRKKKKEMKSILSSHDKQAAKEILTDLLDLRNNKKKGENNQVLESMISIISLSSTNLTLPSVPTNNTVKFKDLFDFEVNYCESREVFEKLAMGKSEESHTLQDLFPWSDKEGGNLNKMNF